jgi:hypothetical protein
LTDPIPNYFKWISSHLALLAVVAGITYGSVYFVDSLLSKQADAEAAKWQTVLTKQQQFSQDLLTKATEQATQLTAVNTSLLASNQKLAASITFRNTQTQAQIQKDSSLTAQEISVHLADITKGNVSTQADNVILDLPTARTVTERLDLLPSVQADLTDTQKQLAQERDVAANLQTVIDAKEEVIVQDSITLADTVKADAAELKKVKADSRKSKFKVFGAGFILGFLVREFIKFPTL